MSVSPKRFTKFFRLRNYIVNEIGEEFNIDEIESNLGNNLAPKHEKFGQPSRRNTYFMRSEYVTAGRITNFSFVFIPTKTTTFEEIRLAQLTKQDTP